MPTSVNPAPGPDPAAPKNRRIFVSYGHDEFQDFAARLVEDLRATQRYEVWFDKNDILGGAQWPQEVEKGLTWVTEGPDAGRVILLMTPHSVLRPKGYCRKELLFAKDRDVKIVPVMVLTVALPIEIYDLHYVDMTDCVPVSERAASYQRKFENLCQALDGTELVVEGGLIRLRRALRPSSPGIDTTYYLPRFVERRSLIGAFDQWVADPGALPVFWITGALGTGKSTLAAWLCAQRSQIKAFHVCGYLAPSKANSREALRSITWQLATQLPGYAERLSAIGELDALCKDPDVDLFDRLIVQPMYGLPAPEAPVVVLIDALDEAAAADVNSLAELLGRELPRLPPWLRFALTSTPDPKVTQPLQAWEPLEIVTDSAENVEEVLEYVERYIASNTPTGKLEPGVLQRLLAASEYNWLYLDWVRRALEQKHLTLQTVDAFPQGLGGAWHHEFVRRFPLADSPERERYGRLHRPFLAVLAAACEPLGTADYARVLGRTQSEVNGVVQDLGGLVSVRDGRVRPFHHALVSWLTDPPSSGDHGASPLDGHRSLADDGWAQFAQDASSMGTYARAHLPRHLLESGGLEKLQRCVTDAQYIAARLEADNLFDVARYWKGVPPRRLGQLCAESHEALRRRGADGALLQGAAVGTGQLFQQVGLYAQAIAYFGKALQQSRRAKDPAAVGQAELNIGWCLRHQEKFERAITHASAALKHFRAAGSQEGRARALSVRGLCHWHLRDDLAALRDLQDAASLHKDCGDDRSRAEALNHLGIVERSLGMYDEALEALRESEALSTRFKDERSLGKCLNSLATASWWMGDLEAALELYRRADAINEKVNQPYVQGLTANNLGYLYLEKGLHRQAYQAFRLARSIRQQLRIEAYEMMDVSGMALASHHLGRYEEARELSRQAVRRLRHVKTVEDLERAYHNHALILAAGTRSEREEGARAARTARALVMARSRKIGDAKVVARFQASVPLVRAILAAGAPAERRRPVRPARRPARAGGAGAKTRRRAGRRPR